VNGGQEAGIYYVYHCTAGNDRRQGEKQTGETGTYSSSGGEISGAVETQHSRYKENVTAEEAIKFVIINIVMDRDR